MSNLGLTLDLLGLGSLVFGFVLVVLYKAGDLGRGKR